jgi:hypothetical protein
VRTFDCDDCYVRVIQSHPSLDCDSSTYRGYSAIFALILITELAVPLGISISLIRKGLNVQKTDRFFRIFSMFIRFYPSGHWTMLWELMGTFIRRIPLLSVIAFSSDAQSRLAWCGIFVMLHLVLQICFRPFLDPVDNLLEAFSQMCLSVMIFILVSGNLDAIPTSEQAMTHFSFFLVVALILLCFVGTYSLGFLKCGCCTRLDRSLHAVKDRVFELHQRASVAVDSGIVCVFRNS